MTNKIIFGHFTVPNHSFCKVADKTIHMSDGMSRYGQGGMAVTLQAAAGERCDSSPGWSVLSSSGQPVYDSTDDKYSVMFMLCLAAGVRLVPVLPGLCALSQSANSIHQKKKKKKKTLWPCCLIAELWQFSTTQFKSYTAWLSSLYF